MAAGHAARLSHQLIEAVGIHFSRRVSEQQEKVDPLCCATGACHCLQVSNQGLAQQISDSLTKGLVNLP